MPPSPPSPPPPSPTPSSPGPAGPPDGSPTPGSPTPGGTTPGGTTAPDPRRQPPAPDGVRRVQGALQGLGVRGTVRALPEPAPTAATAAAQLGIAVGAIANSLVFDADGRPLLVLTSGAHRADTVKLAALVEAHHVRRASPEFVRRHTGQSIGGVAPVGHPHPLATIVDVELSRFDVVWAAGGHPHYVFPTSYDELLRVTAGQAAEVGEAPASADAPAFRESP